jgi:hypothetical protein
MEHLEDHSANFYDTIVQRDVKNKETFVSFANESRKTKDRLVRIYRETVSDALETGFSFADFNLKAYRFETTLTQDTSYSDMLKMAITLEAKASQFYLAVAEKSKALLATLPIAFKKASKTRQTRKQKLALLLNGLPHQQ